MSECYNRPIMALPEQGTVEYDFAMSRIDRRIMDTASNVAVRQKDLPPQIHVLVYDDETGEKFGAYVGVEYLNHKGAAKLTRTSIGRVRPGLDLMHIVDTLLKSHSGTPIVCDQVISQELSQGVIPWFENDHYTLSGRPGGTIEIYTLFAAQHLPVDDLPPGVTNVQIYTE